MSSVFMTRSVETLGDEDVGLISKCRSWFFSLIPGTLSSTDTEWHMSLLVQKRQNFSSKQKGRRGVKVRDGQRRADLSCLQTGGGGEEEGEEKLRWRGEERGVHCWNGNEGIRRSR